MFEKMRDGWIFLHRQILKNPISSKPDYFSLFICLLLLANHQDNHIIISNAKTLIKRGQLLTSRLKLSQMTGIHPSKVERILKYLKSEQQIEQQNLVIGRLITITNYNLYQKSEQQNEHGMNSERTRNEQRVNTINNDNNVNNDNKKTIYTPSRNDGGSFEEIWKRYPNRVGKKAALKHYQCSVKTDEDKINIEKSLDNYLKSERVLNGYIQNGSTWFNNWKDWLEIKSESFEEKRKRETEETIRRLNL